MIGKAIEGMLNDQIQAELYSAYLYLAMSAWCETLSLQGHAAWMRRQAREEIAHAMKLYEHITDRSGTVLLKGIDEPPASFKSPLEMWQKALAHERLVTARIHKLCESATKARDHAALEMLQWFVKEQVEEEKTAETILEQVKLLGDSRPALFFLDRHLGKEAAAKS